MTDGSRSGSGFVRRLLREPTLHFFALAALLFLVHRLVFGDPRVIVVRAGLRADLERRLRDQQGRPPTSSEMQAVIEAWERDEVLYREALRDRLDRDDPTIRMVLADKMRARAVREMPKREPTEEELKEFMAAHRADYETPLRYDFELVSFPKKPAAKAGTAEELRASFQRGLAAGTRPSMLGRPVISGTLTREDLTLKFGPAVSARICSLTPGPESWAPAETQDSLLLVRLNRIEGGLPTWDVLRPQVRIEWDSTARKQAVERMTRELMQRYRIEERP